MLSKEALKNILADQRQSLLNRQLGIERQALSRISSKVKLPHVIVITGLRRVGKSTLMRQIINKFYNDRNFYYINFEDERLLGFSSNDFNLIYEALLELYGKQTVFFIDEVQNIPDFETFVRRFYDNGFKFFLTGSNAQLLSGEIATKLTGRHIDFYLPPFSFAEFLELKGHKLQPDDLYITDKRVEICKLFDKYLEMGGMPEFLKYEDIEILQAVYNDIVLKDIVQRYNVHNVAEIKQLYRFLIANFSRKYSYNSLRKATGIGSTSTVIKYLNYLENAFFIREISKFSFSQKAVNQSEKKVYIVDNGFIRAISPVVTRDRGWLLENMVFNYLSELGDVYFYSGKNECDFIVKSTVTGLQVFQVSYELYPENEQREINGLLEAMKVLNLSTGYLLTYETEKELVINDKKIKIMPVWKWLSLGLKL